MKRNLERLDWRSAGAFLALLGLTGALGAKAELVLDDEVDGVTSLSRSLRSEEEVVDEVEPAPTRKKLTRGDLIRRERLRAELKSEDILAERLEELRLREENRRMKKILAAAEAESAAPAPVELAQAPVPAQPVGQLAAQPEVTAMGSLAAAMEEESSFKIGITPRGGVSTMIGNDLFNVVPRFSVGAAATAMLTDYVGLEVGYQYSEFGVQLGSANPWVNMIQGMAGAMYSPNFETYALRQHVIDTGVKIYVLGPQFRVRPFIGAGGGYGRSHLNYDQRILTAMQHFGMGSLANDYTVDAFLGQLSTGADVTITKNISVGLTARYYGVLTARENAPLWGPAFGGFGMAPGYGLMGPGVHPAAMDPNKNLLGGSLGRAGFFTISGNLNFSF